MSEPRNRAETSDLRSLAFDALPSEIAVIDDDGTILETNGTWEAFAKANGITFRPEMIGMNYLDACDAADDDGHATEAASGIRTVIDGEQSSFSFEYPCHGPDERRWFMMRAIPIEYEGRRCVVVVHTNITERREAELDVEARNEKLELLSGILSHDLRNPMNVALVRAEMLDGDDDNAEIIARSLGRMNDIIDDVLMLVRGSEVENTVPVDLPTLARAAWSHVATGDAELVVEPGARIEAEDRLLTQLLENLYRNAVEHGSTSPDSQSHRDAVEHGSTSPDSQAHQDAVEHGSTSPGSQARQDAVENAGEDVAVTVGPLDDGDGFFVADDGPGIPAHDSGTVFEPGYTTNAADGGTGLGLAIVDRVADAHGWDVRVTDAADGGARFEFSGVTSTD